MSTVIEIESAIRELPVEQQHTLALRINDLYWEAWDKQIEKDSAAGDLDFLIEQAEKEIKEGLTKPLDEILRDS